MLELWLVGAQLKAPIMFITTYFTPSLHLRYDIFLAILSLGLLLWLEQFCPGSELHRFQSNHFFLDNHWWLIRITLHSIYEHTLFFEIFSPFIIAIRRERLTMNSIFNFSLHGPMLDTIFIKLYFLKILIISPMFSPSSVSLFNSLSTKIFLHSFQYERTRC